MILYFRALTSIFISLLAISVFIALIVGVYSINSDSFGFAKALGMSLMVAAVGLVLFGFTGALFWSVLFKVSNRYFKTDFKAHVFSVMLSMPIVIAVFLSFQSGADYKAILKIVLMFTMFIFPVAFLSLYIYKKSYLDSKVDGI
jgi:hypothetical protein